MAMHYGGIGDMNADIVEKLERARRGHWTYADEIEMESKLPAAHSMN